MIGGTSRRGSYYDDGTTKRATVAMVTDDPDHKAAMREGLAGAFGDDDGKYSSALYSFYLYFLHCHF